MSARAYLDHRYQVLLFALLLTVGLGPALQAIRPEGDLLHALLGVSLLLAIVPDLGRGRRWLLIAVLAVASVVGLAVPARQTHIVASAGDGLWALLGLVAAAAALRFALRGDRVDREHLCAALCAYMLAGIFLGVLYAALERSWPGSFGLPPGTETTGFTSVTAIYFSFVTLATLGYGDVVPRSDVARGLAVAEAVAGQFYLAVMVARLLSLYVGNRSSRSS